jgi:hypothetical protein
MSIPEPSQILQNPVRQSTFGPPPENNRYSPVKEEEGGCPSQLFVSNDGDAKNK